MFRNGQWVRFDAHNAIADAPGVQKAKDGKVVGIFCYGKEQPHKGPHIAVVNTEGENLEVSVMGTVITVLVDPNQPGLVPITDRDDIPLKRIEHGLRLNPNWQPSP